MIDKAKGSSLCKDCQTKKGKDTAESKDNDDDDGKGNEDEDGEGSVGEGGNSKSSEKKSCDKKSKGKPSPKKGAVKKGSDKKGGTAKDNENTVLCWFVGQRRSKSVSHRRSHSTNQSTNSESIEIEAQKELEQHDAEDSERAPLSPVDSGFGGSVGGHEMKSKQAGEEKGTPKSVGKDKDQSKEKEKIEIKAGEEYLKHCRRKHKNHEVTWIKRPRQGAR